MASSIKDVIKAFTTFSVAVHPIVNRELKVCAVKVRDTAVKKFGHYQPAVGGYPAWSPLAASTEKVHERAGAGGDPLIGHYNGKSKNKAWPAPLRQSIDFRVDGWTATIGTADPLGKYHEFGCIGAGRGHNTTIPPRPFLRPALYQNADFIHKHLAAAIGIAIHKM